jgi:prepilin peptidase dependent protein B
LLLAITTLFSTHFSFFNITINANTLEQQLQMSMNLITDEIRRAGFWANAYTDLNSSANNSNPFMASGTDLSITSGNCILFTYDHAKGGTLPAISSSGDDDRYGFRVINQVLQTRPAGATFSCSAAASNWENITNSNIVQITALTFTLNQQTVPIGTPSKYILIRNVSISMTGQLTAFPTITKTLTQIVRIRNDKYAP